MEEWGIGNLIDAFERCVPAMKLSIVGRLLIMGHRESLCKFACNMKSYHEKKEEIKEGLAIIS
jgi:hypothetical protein